ncbi:HAD-like protein [Patellaria atrata CBS 101060]|uniref:HAD-like protein n=1 Tax=Patellaria atrata CBS 101060 TaxID=1346257 RepID=A0A9P4S8V8_9PEZI|nr:HAD-like protein [Patellaria atrata CBS 101060]
MSPSKTPKAILFDIGGVCVISPFRAILDYELHNHIPIGWINFSIARSSPQGAWPRLERGEIPLDDAWFAQFSADLTNPSLWAEFLSSKAPHERPKVTDPTTPPQIDAKTLFWDMMRISRTPDPEMYPALVALVASGKFLIAALSNTVKFPVGIRDERGDLFNGGSHSPIPSSSFSSSVTPDPNTTTGDGGNGPHTTLNPLAYLFTPYISSAHCGLRKPDPRIYHYALAELNRVARAQGRGELEMRDVLFLDDIGANLKAARRVGMRTLKVELGRTGEAVRELEGVTGLDLSGVTGTGRARL